MHLIHSTPDLCHDLPHHPVYWLMSVCNNVTDLMNCSVAAAATAASLLTGSSEPIFSSGLAPPPQPPSQLPPQSMSDRPLSPTPTGDAGRMRHVWSSLRDRLGLRAPGMGAPGAEENAGRPSPRDARELLLSEMARAFNLGLGVGSPPVVPAANASAPTAPAAEAAEVNEGRNNDVPILPPPGSFERFLIDLQSDLRVALSQESVPVDADEVDEGGESNHEDENSETTEDPDVTSDNESFDTAASNIDDMPELQSVSDEASTISDAHTARESPGTLDDPNMDIRNAQGDDNTATLPCISHVDTFSGEASTGIGSHDAASGSPGAPVELLPSLSLPSGPPPGIGSSSESSATAQDSSVETDMPFRMPRLSPGSPSRTEHTPINWWRLYRFPPIAAPANRGTQASTIGQQGSTPQLHTESQDVHNAAAPTAPSSDASTPSGMSDAGDAMPDAELAGGVQPGDGSTNGDEQRNVVIPVIVVGLQSVNAERQSPMPMPPHLQHHHHHHPHHPHVHHHPPEFADEQQTEGDLMDLDFGSESLPPSMPVPAIPSEFSSEDTRQSRGRSWQSRAADAFRNLRPGRRAAIARQTAVEPPGSRTFLIYVIGGEITPCLLSADIESFFKGITHPITKSSQEGTWIPLRHCGMYAMQMRCGTVLTFIQGAR